MSKTMHLRQRKRKVSKPSRKIPVVLAVLVVLAGSAVISGIFSAPTSRSLSSLAVDRIECNSMEQFVMHIHAHLDVFVNSQRYTIPASIGIVPDTCFYWMHTHDSSGIIHMEAPQIRSFTLGQFLDIWKKSFGNSSVPDGVPKVFVNGREIGGNYKDVMIGAHDEISVVYGSVPASIPSSYTFPEGL